MSDHTPNSLRVSNSIVETPSGKVTEETFPPVTTPQAVQHLNVFCATVTPEQAMRSADVYFSRAKAAAACLAKIKKLLAGYSADADANIEFPTGTVAADGTPEKLALNLARLVQEEEAGSEEARLEAFQECFRPWVVMLEREYQQWLSKTHQTLTQLLQLRQSQPEKPIPE